MSKFSVFFFIYNVLHYSCENWMSFFLIIIYFNFRIWKRRRRNCNPGRPIWKEENRYTMGFSISSSFNYECQEIDMIFFFINYLSKCRKWDGKKKLLHEVNYIPVHIFVENDSVVYLAIYPFYIQLFTLLLLLNSSNGHLHFVLQPELFSRKRIGRHFFQSSTTTLLLKFRFIFKNCNVLHLLHC